METASIHDFTSGSHRCVRHHPERKRKTMMTCVCGAYISSQRRESIAAEDRRHRIRGNRSRGRWMTGDGSRREPRSGMRDAPYRQNGSRFLREDRGTRAPVSNDEAHRSVHGRHADGGPAAPTERHHLSEGGENMEKHIRRRRKQNARRKRMVASRRFELRSQDPESHMIDHYTTRLYRPLIAEYFIMFFTGNGASAPSAPGFSGRLL